MIGVTKDESTLFVGHMIWGKEVSKELFRSLINKIKETFDYDEEEKINQFYLKNTKYTDSEKIVQQFLNFYSDVFMKCPAHHFAKRFANNTQNKNVYMFLVAHVMDGTPPKLGIYHTAELPFVFGLPLMKPSKYSDIDVKFSQLIVDHWTNFAKYG